MEDPRGVGGGVQAAARVRQPCPPGRRARSAPHSTSCPVWTRPQASPPPTPTDARRGPCALPPLRHPGAASRPSAFEENSADERALNSKTGRRSAKARGHSLPIATSPPNSPGPYLCPFWRDKPVCPWELAGETIFSDSKFSPEPPQPRGRENATTNRQHLPTTHHMPNSGISILTFFQRIPPKVMNVL